MEKKLKIALCILIIALITIIAFVGVYAKNQITYENVLPNYVKSSELEGKRVTNFKLSTSTEEIIYDKDGNKVEAIPEGANEEEYKKEQVPVNPEEVLTTENYEKVKKIFEGRLNDIGVTDYAVRLNKTTGTIAVELPENSNTDNNIQYLMATGEFTLEDEEDGTVLMDMSDVESASARYGTTEEGTIGVYLNIKFNKEGTEKLLEVSRNYLATEDSDQNVEEDTNTATDGNTVEDTNTVDNTTTATDSESTENKEDHKHVTMKIEGIEVLSTYFAEEISSGELTVALGTATTQDTLYDYLRQAQIYAMILNNGAVPVLYDVTLSEYIASNDTIVETYTVVAILVVISLAIAIFLIIKFKKDGIIAGMSLLAMISILLLLIRYTNTALSLGGIISVLVVLALESYFIMTILNRIKQDSSNENVANATLKIYLDKIDVIVVFLIIAVVFTFMNSVKIYSIGMTLFYGAISIAIANLVFMRTMLIARYKLERKD